MFPSAPRSFLSFLPRSLGGASSYECVRIPRRMSAKYRLPTPTSFISRVHARMHRGSAEQLSEYTHGYPRTSIVGRETIPTRASRRVYCTPLFFPLYLLTIVSDPAVLPGQRRADRSHVTVRAGFVSGQENFTLEHRRDPAGGLIDDTDVGR